MEHQTLLLIVVALALLFVGRMIAGGFTVRNLLYGLVSWTAIALIAFVAVTHQRELAALVGKVADRFDEPQTVEGGTVRIPMSRDGHFWAKVRINGVERRMLIDSGATVTALSTTTARDVGVTLGSTPVILDTANGSIQARTAEAARVEIGPLTTRNLEVVVAPSFGEFDVLGMNFLSRLKSWRVEGKTLVLEPSKSGPARKLRHADDSAR